MDESSTRFLSIEPCFSSGQLLTAENMNQLRNHLYCLGSAVLNRYSDGVIHGLDLHKTEDNRLVLEPGVFKLNGKIGILENPLPVACEIVETHALFLIENETYQQMAPGNVSSVPERVPVSNVTEYRLSWCPAPNNDFFPTDKGLELGRVRRIKNLPLTDYYQNNRLNYSILEDIFHIRSTPKIGDILLLYVPYSCNGRYPTLNPRIQEAVADFIIAQNRQEFFFMLPSLYRGDFPLCQFIPKSNNLYSAIIGFYRKLVEKPEIQVSTTMKKNHQESFGPIVLD